MISHATAPLDVGAVADGLDGLVGQLFPRASRRRSLVLAGWVLALGAHAGAALIFANPRLQTAPDRQPPPVDVEFINPPDPPPVPPEAVPSEETKAAPT